MMSDAEDFLARWSRLKRDESPDSVGGPKPRPPPEVDAPETPEAAAASEVAPPVDPATLPSIETIEAGSDIRAFLAPGVPADLKRAALRRAWSSDPSIRDFVGLSENSWDFNAPERISGFGSIGKEKIQELLERVFGVPEAPADTERPSMPIPKVEQATQPGSDPEPAETLDAPPGRVVPPAETPGSAVTIATQDRLRQGNNDAIAAHDVKISQCDRTVIAAQKASSPGRQERSALSSRRRHGGALPNWEPRSRTIAPGAGTKPPFGRR